jgi:hypothetical protein
VPRQCKVAAPEVALVFVQDYVPVIRLFNDEVSRVAEWANHCSIIASMCSQSKTNCDSDMLEFINRFVRNFEMLDTYLKVLDLAYFEVGEAFDGLADENVWKRPAAGLLSVGELAGHVAYWEAARFACDFPEKTDMAKCAVKSPLIDNTFRYYSTNLDLQPSTEHLAMTAAEVLSELRRVHKESVEHLKSVNPELGAHPPGLESYWTYETSIQYMCFHVSYHVGQMYSVRHLLGERTPDN